MSREITTPNRYNGLRSSAIVLAGCWGFAKPGTGGLQNGAGWGKSARTVEATKDIYLDLDKEGRVIGIELLDLKLLHPSIGPVLDITSKRPRRRRKEMAL
jgi:uncharacterized protein YuzE